MFGYNYVVRMGPVHSAPEIRYTQEGQAVVSFVIQNPDFHPEDKKDFHPVDSSGETTDNHGSDLEPTLAERVFFSENDVPLSSVIENEQAGRSRDRSSAEDEGNLTFLVCYGHVAEEAWKILKEGKLVLAEGSMKTFKWVDGWGRFTKKYGIVVEKIHTF